MIISVYSSKGGVGKTPIATNIILDREFAVGTNDTESIYPDFLDDDRVLAVDLAERFPRIPEGMDVVFDLAGAISKTAHSLSSAISQSELVIVPVDNIYQSIKKALETLREISQIEGFTGEVLVVATKLKKERKESFRAGDWQKSRSFQNIKNQIAEAGYTVPTLPLKFSTAFDAIVEKELSIAQLCDQDPLAKYNYREVRAQFDDIYNVIDLKSVGVKQVEIEKGTHNAEQEQLRQAEG